MDAREMPSQEQEVLADEVNGEMGEPQAATEGQEAEGGSEQQGSQDPLYVQKRLKQQKRAHEREIRELHARLNEMQSHRMPEQSQQANSYYNQPHGMSGGVDEQIHKAVSYALGLKDQEERKAKEAQSMAHVHRQYQDLHKHLDAMSDKYDDFDDTVRGHDAPFTDAIRDAALMLPKQGPGSAGEVLYKLGKNSEDLKRISKLHPLDQASELVKLSHAMISGGDHKSAQPRSMGNIKSNPVSNSHSITDKTSVSELRRRMRAGWK